MIISREKKYIFIRVPKTAGSSISSFLLDNDETAIRNQVPDKYGRWVGVNTHISMRELREIMGDSYNQYYVFGFIREPLSKIFSAYNFYCQGRAFRRMKQPGANNWSYGRVLRETIAELLPFKLWVVFYPFATSSFFITDQEGSLLATKVGIYENIEEDFKKIAFDIGLSNCTEALPVFNVSDISAKKTHFGWLSYNFIRLKSGKDFSLYEKIANQNKE